MLTKRATTTLTYGASGTTKTHNVGLFARYVYETTGKPTRLISADAGGTEPIQEYIDTGIVQPVFVTEDPDLLGKLVQLCRGYWPDSKGKLSKEGLDGVGAYAFEGITTTSQLLMTHFAQKGQKINEEVVGQFSEAGLNFGANPRSHYGFIPQQIYGMLTDLGTLPVGRVLITAHEGRGQDDFTKQLVYGPASIGQAATSRIPPYVGDLIHYDTVEVAVGTTKGIETRAYFTRHPDPQTRILWPAKVRLSPTLIPKLQAKWPEGYIKLELNAGIDQFFRFQDEAMQEAVASTRRFKEAVDAARL